MRASDHAASKWTTSKAGCMAVCWTAGRQMSTPSSTTWPGSVRVRRTRWGWSGVVLEQASDRLVARYVPRLLGGGTLAIRDQPYTLRNTTTGRGWQLQDVNKAVIWTMRPVKVNARMKHSDDGDPIVTEVELGARGPGQENTVFTILLGVWITVLEEESRSRSRPGPGPNV